jgi:signal transduction histidine kinase
MLSALVHRNRTNVDVAPADQESLAYLVHDIRSVATSVSLMVDLLELAAKADDDTVQQARAVSAQSSCNQMALLCTEVAKHMSGGSTADAELEAVDLDGLLQELHDIFSPIFDLTGKSLQLVLSNRPIVITGDRSLVFRAISNLLDNALKHTSKGSEVVVTSATILEETIVTVSDDGPGASGLERSAPRSIDTLPVVVRHISNVSAIFSPGTGLRYVSETMTSHGGEATAELNEQGGSSFSLIFPKFQIG